MGGVTPAIVLHCSKAGLAVARGLGAAGIPSIGVGYGRGQVALGSRHVREALWAPDPERDETGFVEFLLALAPRFAGAVLFPTDDASLLAVAKHKEQLAPQFRVVAAEWTVVQQLLEKVHTYEVAHRSGVLAPRVRVITDVADAVAFAGEVGYPCLVKPSLGHTFFKRFGRKMLLAGSRDELVAAIEGCAGYDDELMLSEFIPGDDQSGANYNSFYLDGRPLQEFTAQKVRLKPQGIGFPTAVVTRALPEIIEAGRIMLGAFGFEGFSCMEFKRDARDGRYKLMEINARHNFSGMLALSCGINFPELSYRAALGEPIAVPSRAVAEGRYWVDEERDFTGLVRSLVQGPRAAREYIRPYLGPRTLAVGSIADPKPALRLIASAFGSRLGARRGWRGRSGDSDLAAGSAARPSDESAGASKAWSPSSGR